MSSELGGLPLDFSAFALPCRSVVVFLLVVRMLGAINLSVYPSVHPCMSQYV